MSAALFTKPFRSRLSPAKGPRKVPGVNRGSAREINQAADRFFRDRQTAARLLTK